MKYGVARRLGLDGNELRRPVDRVRAWVTVGAVLLFLGCVPLVTRPVMTAVHDSAVRTARAQARHRHPVGAVVPHGARPAVAMDGIIPDRVAARWPGPDGRWHHGYIEMSMRVPAGGVARIWVDDRARPVAGPLSASQIRGRTGLGAAGAGAGLALVVGLAVLVLRRRLDRRAYAEWELEWSVMEPRWTRRN